MNNSKLMSLRDLRCRHDARIVRQRMKLFSGNVTAVAKSLGVTRQAIYNILEKGRGKP